MLFDQLIDTEKEKSRLPKFQKTSLLFISSEPEHTAPPWFRITLVKPLTGSVWRFSFGTYRNTTYNPKAAQRAAQSV